MPVKTNDASEGVETDDLSAHERFGEGFDVSVHDDERDVEMLVQGGPGGYQLDLWWQEGDKKKQSNNWANFGDQSLQYPHDNDHDREAALDTTECDGKPALHIHDPDPRADKAGYDGADIYVSRHEDGFLVELEWTDEMGEDHRYVVVAPMLDPRINPMEDEDTTEREAYYDYMLPLEDTTGGPSREKRIEEVTNRLLDAMGGYSVDGEREARKQAREWVENGEVPEELQEGEE